MRITIFVFLAILLLNSCINKQSKLEEINSNTPDWLNNIPPEDVLWGIGIGNLSTVKASCELAKFNAQTDISRQISSYIKDVSNSIDQSLQVEIYDLIDQLNVYQNEFYMSLMANASEQVSFELSELVKIERKTKTSDGNVWYLLSIRKKDAENIFVIIDDYIKKYFESYTAEVEKEISEKKKETARKMLDDMLRKP
jgi:hypothetical protein